MALFMLSLLVLTSCGGGESVDDIVPPRRPLTITLLTIVEESTTPEAIALLERELSRITEAMFTTRLRLLAFTPGEYEAELERRFSAFDDEQELIRIAASEAQSLERASREQARRDRAAGIPTVRTERPTQPPRTTEEFTERIIWPELRDNQIDIFLINSTEMFGQLNRDGRLQPMDDELNTKAKVLNSYLHPTVMRAGMFNERTVAIATNKIIGEATYFAINKRLAEASGLDMSGVREYHELTEYLEWVKANEPAVALMDGPLFDILNLEPLFREYPYFALASEISTAMVYTPERPWTPAAAPTTAPPTDEDGFIIGGLVPLPPVQGESTTIAPTAAEAGLQRTRPIQLLTNPSRPQFRNKYSHAYAMHLGEVNEEFREKGLFETRAVTENMERSVFIAQGTLIDRLAWEAADRERGIEYEYVLVRHPVAYKEDLQDSMYGIFNGPRVNAMRSMEIITLMNTDRNFRNLFQYGIEGTHYVRDDDGMIVRISDEWMINMDYAGNHFITDLEAGENPDRWRLSQEHNLNIKTSVFFDMHFDWPTLMANEIWTVGERNRAYGHFFEEGDEIPIMDLIPVLNDFSLRLMHDLAHGIFPREETEWNELLEEHVLKYPTIRDYIHKYVFTAFREAGYNAFVGPVRNTVVPEMTDGL
jgi:hypothetical protein